MIFGSYGVSSSAMRGVHVLAQVVEPQVAQAQGREQQGQAELRRADAHPLEGLQRRQAAEQQAERAVRELARQHQVEDRVQEAQAQRRVGEQHQHRVAGVAGVLQQRVRMRHLDVEGAGDELQEEAQPGHDEARLAHAEAALDDGVDQQQRQRQQGQELQRRGHRQLVVHADVDRDGRQVGEHRRPEHPARPAVRVLVVLVEDPQVRREQQHVQQGQQDVAHGQRGAHGTSLHGNGGQPVDDGGGQGLGFLDARVHGDAVVRAAGQVQARAAATGARRSSSGEPGVPARTGRSPGGWRNTRTISGAPRIPSRGRSASRARSRRASSSSSRTPRSRGPPAMQRTSTRPVGNAVGEDAARPQRAEQAALLEGGDQHAEAVEVVGDVGAGEAQRDHRHRHVGDVGQQGGQLGVLRLQVAGRGVGRRGVDDRVGDQLAQRGRHAPAVAVAAQRGHRGVGVQLDAGIGVAASLRARRAAPACRRGTSAGRRRGRRRRPSSLRREIAAIALNRLP